jgi:deoxyribonuclease-4
MKIGGETIQIFGSSPHRWALQPIPDAEIESFRENTGESGLGPVYPHAIYLINPGSADQGIVTRGIESLINDMTLAANIGASGVIFHPGSPKGAGYDAVFEPAVEAIKRVPDRSPAGPYLCLENMPAWASILAPNSKSWGT